jgi:HSP20 family molecular chaperone IbpA
MDGSVEMWQQIGWHRLSAPVGPPDEAAAARWVQVEWILSSNRRAFRPAFDVYETDRHIVIKVEIAGMREEDFDISLDGQVLHIGGVRGDSGDKLAYQHMEINYGEFRLDIRLPFAVDQSSIEAFYERGFLSVLVPRQPESRRVPITGANDH